MHRIGSYWAFFLSPSMEQRVKLASVLYIFGLFLLYTFCLFKIPTNTKLDMCGYCTVCEPLPYPLFPGLALLVTIPN